MASSTPPEAATPAIKPADWPTATGTDWLRSLPLWSGGEELGPQQLAWLGDAVWELHQRLIHCQRPIRAASAHRSVVAAVRAEAQQEALERLEPLLAEGEKEWVRRGRNRAGRGPRRGEASTYGQATGFETMLGWLFLRNPRRLAELLDHLANTASPAPPSHPP